MDKSQTSKEGDRRQPMTVITKPWTILSKEDTSFLIFQEDGKSVMTPELYRFNAKPGGDKEKHSISAFDTSGMGYRMEVPQATTPEEVSWADATWNSFWSKVGVSGAGEVTSTSFYRPELGAEHRQPRNLYLPTPPVGLTEHRRYNVSHLRVSNAVAQFYSQAKFLSVDLDDAADLFIIPASELTELELAEYEVDLSAHPSGGVTLTCAIQAAPGRTDPSWFQITYGAAVCSGNERYDRRRGLSKASERMRAMLAGRDVGSQFGGRLLLRIHPDSVYQDRSEFCVLKTPWFPKGKVLQRTLLEDMLSTARRTLKPQNRVYKTLVMASATLEVEMRRAGIFNMGLQDEPADPSEALPAPFSEIPVGLSD